MDFRQAKGIIRSALREASDAASRPWCIACQRPMTKCGYLSLKQPARIVQLWRCRPCLVNAWPGPRDLGYHVEQRKEEWRLIPGHARYEASESGEIRNTATRRLLKPQLNQRGYLAVRLATGVWKRCEWKTVHRLIAYTFLGLSKKEVNHKDGDKANPALSNLEYVTRSENVRHAFKTGLFKPRDGQANANAKLTGEQVSEVRALRASGARRVDISRRFQISEHTVWKICTRQSWRRV